MPPAGACRPQRLVGLSARTLHLDTMAPRQPAAPPLTEVLAARRRLMGRAIRTPLVRSAWLSSETGADVFLKLESLQITNSFKLRGAWNAAQAMLERLPPGEAPP